MRMQTPGVLEQPKDPPGAVWGPAPSSPCASSGDSTAHLGAPLLTLRFCISFHLAGLWGEIWCSDRNGSKKNNHVHEQAGHGRQLSVQTQPRHTCACFPFWQQASWPGQVPGAWQHRGAAGATLAYCFKMSQWDSKSDWHPVFNQAVGGIWEAPWLG